ncbi:DUF4349 domain-containing protein [Aeromicrobium endophyticum]|uniref:DUF4349 domain-containing protein n=1 Tax=Aeromicrobium endophyticum TaxID=2292704 RepID=A0A371PER9_9ACTN|nr:DUF4349 domain-containing protein [Aeromicrobium endophyticum]REK73900.1 DUF4349 domain-containing protein [Aeromicrobium endophyticum]
MSTPTLHDDRVEKMRMSVMHRVDQDVTRRGRRARTTIGLAAASVLVVGLGGYAVESLSSDQQLSSAPDQSAGGASASRDAAAPERTRLDAAPQDGRSLRNEQGAEADVDRQVVTTGSASVTVTRPRSTVQQLSTWVESIGGRIDDRSESGRGDDASASVTVRVPSAKVTATIDRLDSYGTVDDVSLQNTDVTAEARDLDARIDALRLSIDRLTAILGSATSSRDVIQAESALTDRQKQLESLQAERKGIADQVSLSTITITFSQRATADSVEPGGFTGGLRDGWNGLVGAVNRGVEVVGVLLPWAAIAAVGLLVVRLVRRRRRSWN